MAKVPSWMQCAKKKKKENMIKVALTRSPPAIKRLARFLAICFMSTYWSKKTDNTKGTAARFPIKRNKGWKANQRKSRAI